jgi:hypothetical protein
VDRRLAARGPARVALALVTALGVACDARQAPGPSASPSPSALAGNALQPLGDRLTWTYRSSTADPTDPNGILGLVIAVVGSEAVGGETAWLIENNLGTLYTSRLVAVERAGDVWVVAIDAIVDGAWKRTTLPAAQLYQPAPGARTWTSDFQAGPEVWRFKADWSQHASGEMTVLGESRPVWLAEGMLEFGDGATKFREVDTFAEGVGLVSLADFFEGGGQRFDLVAFGVDRPPLVGRWVGALEDGEVTLDITAGGATITVGDGTATPVDRWHAADPDVTFAVPGSVAFDASLRLEPWGLVGTATGPDGRARILEFHSDFGPSGAGAPATPAPSTGG